MKHKKCSYIWKVVPTSILRGHGCPECANEKLSDLKKLSHKQFLNKLSNEIRSKYSFLTEYKGMNEKIKVKCNKCEHIWHPYSSSIIKGHGCPKCWEKKHGKARRISNEEFLKRVKEQVKDEYEFLEEYKTSKIKLKVRHNKCGNIYKVSPNNFLNKKTRCPYCFGNQRKTTKQFKQEVYDLVENKYSVLGNYINTKTKIKIKHNECGNIYKVAPEKFLSGRRCPICSSSRMENKIIDFLDKNNINYIHQFYFDNLRGINNYPLKFDFKIITTNNFILLEADGIHHFKPIKHFGGKKYYDKIIKHDRLKENYCKKNNIKLIRIPYYNKNKIKNILNKKIIEKVG